ncbi:hypothetical protein [Chondrinema litorale]|uniref:hypothetical protein n=1 Tax=Chondrinema litorale TaxID=2994555 RepID=UPI002542C28F|nr:hypothetical protein [Chondrinema litorale]UZR94196.1 hypothetical protein OQ292_20370 [Chondrinema litorale]
MTDEIKMDAKFFAFVSGIIVFLTVSIFLLNEVDSKNRETQIKEIYNLIESSPYKNKLAELVQSFDTLNADKIKEIAAIANALAEEEEAIDFCMFYLKSTDSFIEVKLDRNTEKHISNLVAFSTKDKKLLDAHKESSAGFLSMLYDINKDESLVEVYNVIVNSNNTIAYLVAKKYRN